MKRSSTQRNISSVLFSAGKIVLLAELALFAGSYAYWYHINRSQGKCSRYSVFQVLFVFKSLVLCTSK